MLPRFLPKRLDIPAGEILLREVQRKDLLALNRIINEPEVNRFVLMPAPVTMKSTEEHYRENKKTRKVWVACVFDGAAVGSLDIKGKPGRESHVAEFGIAFSKTVHGKGIAEATARACFSWMRKNRIEKVVGEVFADNKRARAFYKKIGFKEMCVLKKQVKSKKQYGDAIMIEMFF
jgi:RimJ/RimL family protein N-acetyltransferase